MPAASMPSRRHSRPSSDGMPAGRERDGRLPDDRPRLRSRGGRAGRSGDRPSSPAGRVGAVSCVRLGSSHSPSKKSSGGTNGPYHRPRMQISAGVRPCKANHWSVAQPASVAPSLELTGRTVAERYVLTGLLGRGGFGTVYSGRDLTGAGEVAVKVFSRSEGFASRAAREARTATKLDHPNIHTCLGVEQDDDHAYLISRLVVGKRLDRSQLSDDEAVRAIAAVADALAHAHERGVVHRDVKPSNILIGDDGAIVLTDFGIARDEDARDQTLDERVLGTLSYMAPEQAAGDQATGATDVWAAALTLYEALTGANPFRTKSLSDLLERLAAGTTPLVQERPDLPRALSRIVQQALHRDPRRRPSAIELRDGLLAAMRNEVDDDDVVSAAHKRAPRELPRFERLQRPAATAMLSLSLVYML